LSISAASISAQDVGFSLNLYGRVWRWKTRMDVSGASPAFQIIDIQTPWGPLRDSIPLPGEIVQGMSDSITSLKANFKPLILVGPPSSLTFSVDEGRGFSLPLNASVTNIGVYGSLLSTTLVVSAPYLHVSPSVVPHLAANQEGSFEVSVDSTDLLASSSPYSGTISIQDSTSPNSPQVLPVSVIVRPKAVITVSPATVVFTATRPLSGPYPTIATQQFTVQNAGPSGSVLDYQIVRLTGLSQNWLAGFTPVTGILNASSTANITVTVAPVEGLMPGTYEETLRVSGYSFNDYTDVLIRLVIT
jgi:hypothetical protein